MLRTVALVFALVIVLCHDDVAAAPSLLMSQHIDDRDLYTRAGYFEERYLYRGGIPKLSTQAESYHCLVSCNATSCALAGSTAIKGSYCILWDVAESGDGQTSSGSCRCTSRGPQYCPAYTCDQTVVATSQQCDSDNNCWTNANTYGKIKSCQCDTMNISSPFCASWTCLGYGDSSVKTALWRCKDPISSIADSSQYSKDFCWTFYSDQFSADVEEVKDCACTQASSDGQFCAYWVCVDRTSNRWIWWSSILASPLAAALQLWVPFVAKRSDTCGVITGTIWVLLTYLLVILLGGVPSLIANTGALLIATCIAFRSEINESLPSISWPSWPQRRQPPQQSLSHSDHTVMGIMSQDGVRCPTCHQVLPPEALTIGTVA